MLTFNTKLICDVCGEIDIVELEYNISARAGSPPILTCTPQKSPAFRQADECDTES